MIVVRLTWPVKRGAEEKAVELIKSLPDYLLQRKQQYLFVSECENARQCV